MKFSETVLTASDQMPTWTVDVHTHVYLPRYVEMLRARNTVPRILSNPDRLIILPGEDLNATAQSGRPIGDEFHDMSRKISFMNTHHIGCSVISTANPWLDFFTPDQSKEALEWTTALNDDMETVCATSNNRLRGFGILPMSIGNWDACAKEVHRVAAHQPNMRGFIIGTSNLDDPAKDALWKAAEDTDSWIFVHPHYGVGNAAMGDQYGHAMLLALGFPFETSAAIARLVLSGVMDRFPRLKVLVAHSGGTLPYLAGRLDSCVMHDFHVAGKLRQRPSDYLRQLYYDSISYQPETLRALVDFAGVDRIMFGTDHPFFSPLSGKEDPATRWPSVDMNYRAMDCLTEEEQRKVRYENAHKLFRLN